MFIFGILFIPCIVCFQPEKWVVNDALDCSKPLTITNAPLSKICNPNQAGTIPGLAWEKNVTLSILQYDEISVIKAVKCSKQVSTFEFYCGRWSHAVWVEPPKLFRHEKVNPDSCVTAYHRRMYRTEQGQDLPVPEGGFSTLSYSYVRVGDVLHDSESAWCNNGKTMEKGELHENLVVMVDVKFSIQEIELEVSRALIKDLSTSGVLPERCRGPQNCQLPTETYIKLQMAQACHLYLVREGIQFEQYGVLEGTKKSTFLVSHPHRLFFVDRGNEKAYHGTCFPSKITLKTTQLHDMFLIQPKYLITSPLKRVQGENVNVDLEIKVAESYVLFTSQYRLMNLLRGVDHRFCMTDLKTLPLYQKSPFTPHHLLRINGELVQELKCREVSVEVPMGLVNGVDRCFNALPVHLDGRLKFMTPNDHILLDLEDVIEVPCRRTPKFVINSTVISSSPRMSTLDHLKLTDITYKYHRSIDTWSDYGLDFMNKFTDLSQPSDNTLYTQQEMAEYLELAHFDRKKQEVQSILTNAYCADRTCGKYQSSDEYFPLDFTPLKLSRPIDIYKRYLSPFESFYAHLKDFLTMFTLYLFIEWSLKTLYSLIQCVQMVHQDKFTKKDAMQISFNSGGQVINSFRELKRKKVTFEDECDMFTRADLEIEPELDRFADEVAELREIRACMRRPNEMDV